MSVGLERVRVEVEHLQVHVQDLQIRLRHNGKGAMRLGGDGVRVSRMGTVRAKGVCGMEWHRG